MTEIEIDQTIGEVERLYKAVTGKEVVGEDKAFAPIPAERDPAEYVKEQLERLSNLLGGPRADLTAAPPLTPPISTWETEESVVVLVELPGVPRDLLHLEAQGDVLHVIGQRPMPDQEGARLLAAERPLGRFQRLIAFPSGMLAGEVSAQLKNGLLEIRLTKPTARRAGVREITVR